MPPAEEKKKDDEDDELVVVEDKATENEEEEDLGLEDEDEEARLGADEEDEAEEDYKRSKVRKERKEERHTRRARQKEARDRDQRELKFLRTRNETLERRFSGLEERVGQGEVSDVDSRISHVKSRIKLADQVIAKAVDAGKGDDLVEAQGIRDDLRDKLTQLNQAKNVITERAKGGGAPQGGTQPDPRLMTHAQKWMQQHDWWDPNGGDEDSLIVSAIDNALVNEDYDPNTAEYWDELSRRVENRVPNRKGGNGDARRRKKGGGPTFRTGGRERPLRKNEVYISPERKDAMIDAGVWDDPTLRQRYLKQYADYDREHQA